MSTQKQIDANRRNVAKSTGPSTAEGKSASRLNALKHGVYANSPVIPGENQALFDDLAEIEDDNPHPLARAANFLFSELKLLQRRIDSAGRTFRLDLDLLNKLQAARQPNPEPPRRQALTRPNGFVPASGATPPAKPAKSPEIPPPDTLYINRPQPVHP